MSLDPKYLMDLSPEQLKDFIDSFDHVFSDCDGVLWALKALPRVGEFFALMKKFGKTVHFVSNNSIRSKEEYERRFAEAGIPDGLDYLTLPSIAIAEYLKNEKLDKTVYSISCPETTRKLESYGFKCKTGPDMAPDILEDYMQFCEDDPEIGAVVMDCDFKVNLAKLHKAITYLKRPDVLFACGATDRQIHFKRGYSALGVHVFTDIAARESQHPPVILSKPSKLFGDFALKRAGVKDPSRVLFIGDMIEQDVGLGRACGFKTLLVLTNITEETMMASKTVLPMYYAESLGSLVPVLERLKL